MSVAGTPSGTWRIRSGGHHGRLNASERRRRGRARSSSAPPLRRRRSPWRSTGRARGSTWRMRCASSISCRDLRVDGIELGRSRDSASRRRRYGSAVIGSLARYSATSARSAVDLRLAGVVAIDPVALGDEQRRSVARAGSSRPPPAPRRRRRSRRSRRPARPECRSPPPDGRGRRCSPCPRSASRRHSGCSRGRRRPAGSRSRPC